MQPKAAWYLCSLQEVDEAKVAPDFSKIPEQRREVVRQKWLSQNLAPAQECLLWGEQINKYQEREGTTVTVVRAATPEEAKVADGGLPPAVAAPLRTTQKHRQAL